jgi:transposase InsO family protein
VKPNALTACPATQKHALTETRRYQKQIPGHHVPREVKFLSPLTFKGQEDQTFPLYCQRRFYPDQGRENYPGHVRENALDFVDDVFPKFPFRIQTLRTDNGHEFQAKCHGYGEDRGIRHVYIKPRTSRLKGKVERSHGRDEREFYQLLTYTDEVDLNEKLTVGENYYNFNRSPGKFSGKIPCKPLHAWRKNSNNVSPEVSCITDYYIVFAFVLATILTYMIPSA